MNAERSTITVGLDGGLAQSRDVVMGKYDPLSGYLRRQHRVEVSLTFRDIERILGGLLPKAANSPDWWSSGDDAPQKRAWASVRFSPEVDLKREVVRFVSLDGRGTMAAEASWLRGDLRH